MWLWRPDRARTQSSMCSGGRLIVAASKPQRTDRVLTCFRIGDPNGEYPIYDSEGARLFPGRWNTPTSPIIYASEHYSTAMLEKLVHSSTVLPPNQHYVRITIPNGV